MALSRISEFSGSAGPRSLFKATQACSQNTGITAWISLLWFPPSWDLCTSDSEGEPKICVCECCSLQSNSMSCVWRLPVPVLHKAEMQCFIIGKFLTEL